ncbi:MAG: hypothetical protein HW373_877 [Deltaproteobacteria bacterium]|nr:hypothetical protein [Deltaproteobacteria bacterium]
MLLAAGKLIRHALGIGLHVDDIQGMPDSLFFLGLRDTAHFKSVGDVTLDVHMRPQGVVLKNHSGIAFVRRHPALIFAVKKNSPFVGVVKPRDRTECRGFAASRRPQKEEQLPATDVQSQIVDCLGSTKDLGDRLECHANRHKITPRAINSVFSNRTLPGRAKETQRRTGCTILTV